MTLWLLLTLMISTALILVVAPFLRTYDKRRAAFAGEVEVFRDQLNEVEREAADGVIDVDQIETARLEIKRRLLGAARANETRVAWLSPGERNLAVVAVAAIVALGSLGIYAVKGSPALSASPTAGRAATTTASDASGRLAINARLPADNARDQSRAAAELATADVMIALLVDRLRQRPDDADGWRMLGWSYFKIERFAEAAAAYGKAVELRPKIASLMASWGEARARAANGLVTAETEMIFDAALKLDGKDPRARFFKGLVKEQAGDKAAALDAWVALLNDAPADADWIPDLKQRIAEMAFDIYGDIGGKNRQPDLAALGSTPNLLQEPHGSRPTSSAQEGASAEAIRNTETMAAADRVAMIRGMVDGLADRLQQSPRDLEGWIELIRSRTVLREMDAALQALDRALKVFADSPQSQRRITAAAHDLGLTR
jgi:cytochrome c-type biogenesis protein CcmH